MKKWIAIILLVLIAGYAITCGLATIGEARSRQNPSKAPSAKDAPYALRIKATGEVIYAAKLTKQISPGTQSAYLLQSYWLLKSKKWERREKPLLLDERVFGPIDLRSRE